MKSDQERAIRSMDGNVDERLFEDDFRETRVVMQHSPVGESLANGATDNAIQRVQGQIRASNKDLEMHIKAKLNPSQTMADPVCCPNALVLQNIGGRRPHGNPENQGQIHHSTEAQIRKRHHVQSAEGRQASVSQKPGGDVECGLCPLRRQTSF